MKYISALLMALLFAGCTSKLTKEQKNQIAKEVETTVREHLNPKTFSLNTHLDLRADKEGYLFAGDGTIVATDYKTFKDFCTKSLADFSRFINLDIIKIYTYVLAEDAATTTMEFKGRFITTAGDTLPNNGCWTMVFIKYDGKWKVIQENGTHTK